MKKISPPNILAVSAAGMFVDRETDEVWRMRLNTSVFLQGKGLMEKFDYCRINSCFELVKHVHILLGTNVVAVLLLQTLELFV